MKKKVDWSNKDLIVKLCNEAHCMSDVCRELELHPSANIRTLKRYIEKYQIDVSHFDPNIGRKRTREKRQIEPIPLEEILTKNSTYHRWHLKRRLIEEGVFENKCNECDLGPRWNERELKLHLDHKNGVNNDQRRENLQLLCPNCHSQTPTYGGRNKLRVGAAVAC